MHTSFSFETESTQEDEHAQYTIEVADVTVDWSRWMLMDLLGMLMISSTRLVLRGEDKDVCGTYERGHA